VGQVTIIVLTQPGIWYNGQPTTGKGDLGGVQCTPEIRAEDGMQRFCCVVLAQLLRPVSAKLREWHICMPGSAFGLVIDTGHMGGIEKGEHIFSPVLACL
jgi:hypothetical protein